MIADYAELIAEVVDRSGSEDVALKAKMFVGMAENAIVKRLRVGEMEAETELTTDADGKTDLPSGFVKPRSVMCAGYILEPRTLTEIKGGAGGYAISAGVMLTSEATAKVDLVYYSRLPSLVENGTNWLFRADPEIYLYAVLEQVFLEKLDIEKSQATAAYLASLIDAKARDDGERRLSPARLSIAGATP